MTRIDVVLSILSVCISIPGILSVFPYLDLLARTVALICVVGALVTARSGAFLRGGLSTALTLVFFAYYGLRLSGQNLITPAMNLLVVLLAIRLVSEKTVRHHLQVCALSLFILAGSSLFSLGPAFLVYLMLLLAMIGVALVIATFSAADSRLFLRTGELKRVVGVALMMPVGTLPLMCFFFLVMPRTPYPLWNLPRQGDLRATGMSESVRPGSTPSVVEARNLVFRAVMTQIDPADLYWRGIVLNSFRDDTWRRDPPPASERGAAGERGDVRATIFPEPQRGTFLVTLDHTPILTGLRVREDPDLIFSRRAALDRRVKYEVSAITGGELKVKGGIDRAFYLRLPDRLPPRIRRLGEEIGAGGDALQKIDRAEKFYRGAGFRYATSGLPTGENALDSFLFDRHLGHCELFASSLGVLLRVAGVPCRLVGGYFGGVYNDMGGYYLVTEDAAHLWVEAFVEGRGWVRLDPSSWATGFSRQERRRAGGLPRLEMWVDALDYAWNVTVINYDLEAQVNLFNAAGDRLFGGDSRKLFRAFVVAVLCAAAFTAAITFYRRHRLASREERLLRRFLGTMKIRYGVEPGPAEGLHDLARRVKVEAVTEFVESYGWMVYRDRPLTADDYRRLKLILRRIRKGEA